MLFSPSTLGFYIESVHKNIPKDAVSISDSNHRELLDGVSAGKLIQADRSGQPVLADPVGPSIAELRTSAANRSMLMFSFARESISKASHYLQASRWPVQLAAAQDLLANGDSASEFSRTQLALEARLRARGESVEVLADKVIANSQVFTLSGAAIDGIETATLDAIKAYEGTDPASFTALIDQARLDLTVELVAIFTPALGETAAQAMASSIVFGA